MAKKITSTIENYNALVIPAETENDLARSAWYDPAFAVWFEPFAKAEVLFNGTRGQQFFQECAEFAKTHKIAFGSVGDDPKKLLESKSAYNWFQGLEFPELPGGKTHKPTSWQKEKAKRYLSSRYDTLLSESLADAEKLRASGETQRADEIATEARRIFTSFSDNEVPCERAMSDVDSILALGDSNPPLFTLTGEMGKMLNSRLKGDNLGIILADQKIGKTSTCIQLAVQSGLQVPTLFVSAGDETHQKIDGRIFTNYSCLSTQPEYAGTYAMPVPDCAHNAMGSCPIGLSGEPRQVKDWKMLIAEGAKPEDLVSGTFDGSRTISGKIYQPCCRCFPVNDGTKEDYENRKRWKSAVWWRNETFKLCNRKDIVDAKNRFGFDSRNGGLRVAAYSAGELSVQKLEDKLDALDRNENFVPEVIVLDYADLLQQVLFRSSDQDHDGLRMIWEGLRALTFKRGSLLITPTQTNRNDLETHTVKTIGRCAKAADNCTWMATLNQTVLEKRAKVMRVSMLYAREGNFDPEHQALCCQWQEVQDSFAFSMPYFCKIKESKDNR